MTSLRPTVRTWPTESWDVCARTPVMVRAPTVGPDSRVGTPQARVVRVRTSPSPVRSARRVRASRRLVRPLEPVPPVVLLRLVVSSRLVRGPGRTPGRGRARPRVRTRMPKAGNEPGPRPRVCRLRLVGTRTPPTLRARALRNPRRGRTRPWRDSRDSRASSRAPRTRADRSRLPIRSADRVRNRPNRKPSGHRPNLPRVAVVVPARHGCVCRRSIRGR